jgi:hypothetical protein
MVLRLFRPGRIACWGRRLNVIVHTAQSSQFADSPIVYLPSQGSPDFWAPKGSEFRLGSCIGEGIGSLLRTLIPLNYHYHQVTGSRRRRYSLVFEELMIKTMSIG